MVSEHYTELLLAHEQLRQYLLQIEELAAVQERKRIAREIHDSLGNALTSLNIQLQTALKLWHIDPSQAERFLTEAQRLGTVAINEVRQSVSSLRANDTPERSLEEMIASVVDNFHQATGVLPSTSISISAPLSIKVVMTIYRIVQESLTNICKYAQATKVQIQLNVTPDNVFLVIQDNGKGFSLSQKKTGFGIQGMQERVTALQGNLNIETEPGTGCKITVELPLLEVPVLEKKTPKVDFSLTISQKNKTNSQFCSVLSLEQYNHLENIFIKIVGPVAPTLLKQVAAKAHSRKELVDNLAVHMTGKQRLEFEKKVMCIFQESTTTSENQLDDLPCNESFLRQCERNLAEFIGPIASFLVQKTVKKNPHLSRAELVEILAAEIPNPQKAYSFQQHLLSNLN